MHDQRQDCFYPKNQLFVPYKASRKKTYVTSLIKVLVGISFLSSLREHSVAKDNKKLSSTLQLLVELD